MKKTILCLLLALSLLLMGAAAMAGSDPDNYSFDIDEGNITIADGSKPGTVTVTYGSLQQTTNPFDASQLIIVRGFGNSHPLNIQAKNVPVKIRIDMMLIGEQNNPITIADNADVTLKLEWRAEVLGGIPLGSGSKLTIDGEDPSRQHLVLFSSSGFVGPTSGESTVIINGGGVGLNVDPPNPGIKGNVNLVINGGELRFSDSSIDVKSLIVTGGVLWANDSTKVTYSNLSDYQYKISCSAGILPHSEENYDQLTVFGNGTMTLPDDLTIPEGKTLTVPEGAGLTIPAGRTLTVPEGATLIVDGALNGTPAGSGTVKFAVKLNANGGTIAGGKLDYYTYGVGATLPTAEHVTRPGYAFAGWYDNAALTGSPVTAIGAGETGVKKLWAGWSATPVITSPAEDKTVTVYEGERATMAITAQHAAAYQWQMSTDGGASWTDCGTDSPAYTTAPAKLADNGTRYRCTVTGSGAAGAPLTAGSPVFTLRVIQRAALPQTGDSSRLAAWLTLLGACCVGLWCMHRRRR